MKFKIGDQIVYIPNHAKDKYHSDAEFGFITGFSPNGSAFCRYWHNPYRTDLRTTANSEATPIDMLYKCNLKSQEFIHAMLVKLGYEEQDDKF